LEDEVGSALRSLRYKFEAQYKLYSTRDRLRAVYDFYLPAHDVAIEVNGTYWHADPRVYNPSKLGAQQRRVRRSWNKKVKYSEQRGIRIIVLWEKDLREAECMRTYIKNKLRTEL